MTRIRNFGTYVELELPGGAWVRVPKLRRDEVISPIAATRVHLLFPTIGQAREYSSLRIFRMLGQAPTETQRARFVQLHRSGERFLRAVRVLRRRGHFAGRPVAVLGWRLFPTGELGPKRKRPAPQRLRPVQTRGRVRIHLRKDGTRHWCCSPRGGRLFG